LPPAGPAARPYAFVVAFSLTRGRVPVSGPQVAPGWDLRPEISGTSVRARAGAVRVAYDQGVVRRDMQV